jgi:L-ascorbate metabolism protein UlaG (beta-lactamase superfamily)
MKSKLKRRDFIKIQLKNGIMLAAATSGLSGIGCVTTGNEMNTKIDDTKPITVRIEGDKYVNWIPTPKIVFSIPKLIWHNLSNNGDRKKPEGNIPIVRLNRNSFSEKPSSGLTLRWLGHSSLILEMNGFRLMIDPMLSPYASPVPRFVERFSEVPIPIDELPDVDFVLISHCHYDHLDKPTVKSLAKKGATFFVPSGVENHLKDWGIDNNKIQSLNWWQKTQFGTLKIVCVPARHFANRGLFDGNETLWAGWVIMGPTKRVFYSGDSGYGNHFKEIGNSLGPFDLAIIENGAYNKAWPYVHSNAENAVQACIDANAKLFLPVHWATFDLSIHSWDEPIIRAVAEAEKKNVKIITPIIGELVDLEKNIVSSKWWVKVK